MMVRRAIGFGGTPCYKGVRPRAPSDSGGTFGDSFNKKGGGVWATQIEADGIKIWYFAMSDIPEDIESDAPDPKNWGLGGKPWPVGEMPPGPA